VRASGGVAIVGVVEDFFRDRLARPEREMLPVDAEMKLPQLRELSGEAILNLVQTFGIIVALSVSAWGVHVQEVAKSAELTLSLTKDLSSGESGVIMMALRDAREPRQNEPSDEAIDEFLDNYELVDMAYHHHLINWDMADDAFSYDLGKALNYAKIRRFLSESRGEEADVLRLGARVGARSRHFVPPDHCDQARCSRYALAPV
jgi:hypothetical protein